MRKRTGDIVPRNPILYLDIKLRLDASKNATDFLALAMEEEESDKILRYLEYLHHAISRIPRPKQHSEGYEELTADIVQYLEKERIEAPEPDWRKEFQNFKTELFEALENVCGAKIEQFTRKQEEKQKSQRKQRQETREDLVRRCQNLPSSRETVQSCEVSSKKSSRPKSKTTFNKSIESKLPTPIYSSEVQEESDEVSEDELDKRSDRSSILDSSDLGSISISENRDPSQYIGKKASKGARGNGSESLESPTLCSNKFQQTQPENGGSQLNKNAPFTKARSQEAKRKSDALETRAPKRSTRERKPPGNFMEEQYKKDQIEKERRNNNRKRKP